MTNIELINLLQRITGVLGYILITLQIFLSTDRKFVKYHKINGVIAYSVIFLHPFLMVLFKYFYVSDFDPFYVYIDICLLCDGKYEMFVNFGRMAFWIVTITAITAFFRGKLAVFLGKKIGDFIDNNWRKIHILNYLVFVFVSIHAVNIGSDAQALWFKIIFWLGQAVFVYAVVKRIRELIVAQ